MPWHIAEDHADCPNSEPFAVVKDDDGKVVGCHVSRDAANKQLAALYANESTVGRAAMTAAKINDLPDSAFAYIEPGGKKDDQGKTVPRSLRHFPIHDAAHVRNALARAPQSPFGEKAMPKIRAAAKKFGIEVSDDAERSRPTFSRLWDLEDCIIRSGGDGRTVEAYAAVFDDPYEITDQHGHYMESIDRTAFNRTLSHGIERVGVFYNHGMTIFGTPSDMHSVPIGRALEIRPDKRGLLTVTRYNRGEDADRVLEAIRNDAIRGYSFRGPIIRSSPKRPPRERAGRPLPVWRHLELGLIEYGPTPAHAYSGNGILAMRSAGVVAALDEAKQLIEDLSSVTPRDPADDTATPDVGLGAEDSRASALRSAQLLRLRSEMRARGV